MLRYQKGLQAEEERRQKELERKEDFVMLLHEMSFAKKQPLFNAKSLFKDVRKNEEFVSDARFAVFVKDEQLKKARQYFDEFCIAIQHMLEADKQILKSYLRQQRRVIKHDDAVRQLLAYLEFIASIYDTPHLRLLFD
eukprot:731072_1